LELANKLARPHSGTVYGLLETWRGVASPDDPQ